MSHSEENAEHSAVQRNHTDMKMGTLHSVLKQRGVAVLSSETKCCQLYALEPPHKT